MKLKIILGILLAVFLIGAGCSKETSTPTGTNTQQPEAPVSEEIAEALEQEIQEEPTGTVLSDEDKSRIEFLEKADKVKSYSYQDFDSKNNYYLKGSKIKIKLFEPVINPYRFDYVYLNTEAKTVYAYCASVSGCTYQERMQYRKTSYDEYLLETPLDKVKGIKRGVIGKETQQIEGVTLTSIVYKDANNNQITFWLHPIYAFPYEIVTETQSGDKTILKYTDAAFNYLKDSDVVPPAGSVLVE